MKRIAFALWWFVWPIFWLLWPAVWAQTGTDTQPQVGAVYTWLGSTLGAHWISPSNQVAPMTITDNQLSSISGDNFTVEGRSQAISGQAIYNQSVFSGNSTSFNGYDSLRGVVSAPPSSTVNTITGVAGYSLNNTVPIGQRSQTAALFGVGVCAADNSNCWGIDTITSDNPTQNNTGVTAGVGKFLFNEFDLNITSPNTQGANLQVGGTALPTNTTIPVNAIGINKLWGAGGAGTGTALYTNGMVIADACCATGFLMGSSALSGANKVGMPMTFNYRDNGGILQNETLTAGFGTLTIGGSSTYGLQIASGINGLNAVQIGAQAVSGTNVPSQNIILNYFDGSSAAQDYGIQVNASRVLTFGSSVGNSVAKFDFEGGLSVNGTAGVTCAPGSPTSSFQTINGLVVHC